MVGHEPRAVIGRGRRRVEQIIARENARKVQARAHAAQPRLDVAIAGVEAVELRVRGVGFPLRRQNRHDDQREQPQQREGDHRPGPKTPAADTRQMLLVHWLILSAEQSRETSCLQGI